MHQIAGAFKQDLWGAEGGSDHDFILQDGRSLYPENPSAALGQIEVFFHVYKYGYKIIGFTHKKHTMLNL